MSDLLSRMFQEHTESAQASQEARVIPCVLHYTNAQEHLVEAIVAACPSAAFESMPLTLPTEQYSEESQQQEKEVARIAADAAVAALTPVAEKTGAVNVYLLDAENVASTDTESQHLLNAAAISLMQNPKKTVLALIPTQHQTLPSETTAAVLEALSPTVKASDAHIVTSVEELHGVIQELSQTDLGDG